MRDNETVAILAGIGIGAALMFFLDPHRSNGKRAHAIEPNGQPALRAVRDTEPEHEDRNDAQQLELVEHQMR